LASKGEIGESEVGQILSLEDQKYNMSALEVKPLEQMVHEHEQRAAIYLMNYFAAFLAIEEKNKI
jgi:hypothetical protein